MNKFTAIGRLVANPELRYTAAGVAFCQFTLVIDRPISREKKDGGSVAEDFIDCTAWRGTAENLCRYKTQGDTIGIEGELRVHRGIVDVKDLDGKPVNYGDGKPVQTSMRFTNVEVNSVTFINQARYAPNQRQQAATQQGQRQVAPAPQAAAPSRAPQRPAKPRFKSQPQGRTDDFSPQGDLFNAPNDPGIDVDEFDQMMRDISDEQLNADEPLAIA